MSELHAEEGLKELQEAYRGGNLVIVAGRGISSAAGLPTWDHLVQLMLKRARWRVSGKVVAEIVALADERRFIDALTASKEALGSTEFAAVIERHLEDRTFQIPELAEAIPALAPRLRAALTTNLDHLLERAFDGAWPVLTRITEEIARRRGFIIKLHGTLAERTSWIITRDDYDHAVLADPKLLAPFSAFFHVCPILFVGYGMGDDDFRQVFARIRAFAGTQPPERFALMDAQTVTPERSRRLERAGVRVIVYSNADGGDAEALRILRLLAASGAALSKRSENLAGPVTVAPTLRQGPSDAPPMAEPPPPPGALYDRRWYVHREIEERLALTHLDIPGAPVVLWGPERVGKSTTLGYLLEHLREVDIREGRRGDAVLITLGSMLREGASLDELLADLARYLVKFMGGHDDWLASPADEKLTSAARLTRLMESRILPGAGARFIMAIEQADAVFDQPFRSELFGLLRGWCEQAYREPWSKLRLVLASATSPALLFSGPEGRYSPWNLAALIELRDLRTHQVEALCRLYGLEWNRELIDEKLCPLVGGHPFLLRTVMHHALTLGLPLGALLEDPRTAFDLFSEHLERLRARLAAEPRLEGAVRGLLEDPSAAVDEGTLDRLAMAGIGVCPSDSGQKLRYSLYEGYLRRTWKIAPHV